MIARHPGRHSSRLVRGVARGKVHGHRIFGASPLRGQAEPHPDGQEQPPAQPVGEPHEARLQRRLGGEAREIAVAGEDRERRACRSFSPALPGRLPPAVESHRGRACREAAVRDSGPGNEPPTGSLPGDPRIQQRRSRSGLSSARFRLRSQRTWLDLLLKGSLHALAPEGLGLGAHELASVFLSQPPLPDRASLLFEKLRRDPRTVRGRDLEALPALLRPPGLVAIPGCRTGSRGRPSAPGSRRAWG